MGQFWVMHCMKGKALRLHSWAILRPLDERQQNKSWGKLGLSLVNRNFGGTRYSCPWDTKCFWNCVFSLSQEPTTPLPPPKHLSLWSRRAIPVWWPGVTKPSWNARPTAGNAKQHLSHWATLLGTGRAGGRSKGPFWLQPDPSQNGVQSQLLSKLRGLSQVGRRLSSVDCSLREQGHSWH